MYQCPKCQTTSDKQQDCPKCGTAMVAKSDQGTTQTTSGN